MRDEKVSSREETQGRESERERASEKEQAHATERENVRRDRSRQRACLCVFVRVYRPSLNSNFDSLNRSSDKHLHIADLVSRSSCFYIHLLIHVHVASTAINVRMGIKMPACMCDHVVGGLQWDLCATCLLQSQYGVCVCMLVCEGVWCVFVFVCVCVLSCLPLLCLHRLLQRSVIQEQTCRHTISVGLSKLRFGFSNSRLWTQKIGSVINLKWWNLQYGVA